MEYLPYNELFLPGIIKCLRGFPELNIMTDNDLEEWFRPLISYSWKDDIDEDQFPYKYGIVLVEDEQVVGYCGLIYSYRSVGGQKKVCVNTTTWIIEPPYRLAVFSLLSMIVQTADIIIDYSPSKEMAIINEKMFGFEYVDSKAYKLFTPDSVRINILERMTSYQDIEEKMPEYFDRIRDHIKYGCKYIYLNVDGEQMLVCYYVTRERKGKDKRNKWAQIIDVNEKDIFTKYVNEVVTAIYQLEKVHVLCDSRFLGNIDFYKEKEIVSRRRMQYAKEDAIKDKGMFYSEMILLGY